MQKMASLLGSTKKLSVPKVFHQFKSMTDSTHSYTEHKIYILLKRISSLFEYSMWPIHWLRQWNVTRQRKHRCNYSSIQSHSSDIRTVNN